MTADHVRELLITEAAVGKLGARSISVGEVEQVPRNAHAIVANPSAGGAPDARRLLVGLTDGARALTLVIEATIEPSTWLVVTGWDSTRRERSLRERTR